MKKKKTIITYGTYDMLHIGHLSILERAKALGDYLIVGVTDENYDRSRGKLNVSQSTEQRVKAIEALDFVDKVILETHKDQKAEDMQKYNVDIFAIGDDWVGSFDYLNAYTKVKYLPRTEGISSTKLRKEAFSTIKIGIAGLGKKTQDFIEEANFVSNVKINRIYSDDLKAIKAFTKDNEQVRYGHDNFDEFLDTSIKAVYIDTNSDQHYVLIKKALKAGKHVLCENPLSIEKHELKELLALAKKEKKVLLTALKTAFLPAFSQLLKELESGVIGEIKEVRATRTALLKERNYPESYISQGATNIFASYTSLLIEKILGKRKEISFFDQCNKEYDSSNLIISRHKNGALGVGRVAIETKSEGDAVISGTKGYVYIPAPWWWTKTFYVRFEDSHKSYTYDYELEGTGLRYMIAEFASLIQRGNRKSKKLTPSDMVSINRVLLDYNDSKKEERRKKKAMIYEDYYIFTPGPVKMSQEILDVGAKQTPYFRNSEFSDVTFACEKGLIKMLNAPEGSKVIFLTASGTAGMESVVMNLLNKDDKALVVHGGGFGGRFVDICAVHDVPHTDFKVQNTNLSDIEVLAPKEDFTSLIVNAHETSVGHLYDLDAMGAYAKKNDLLYIVDAISMLVTDPIDMSAQNIDVVIASSQKGLALPPGLTMVVLTPRALSRVQDVKSLYFNFKDYLRNGERGQTPYTPAVTIMLQLEARLAQIEREGGVEKSIENAKEISAYFRESIKELPLKAYTEFMPNAMTTLTPTDGKSAMDIVNDLEDNYKVMVCPNGGAQRDIIFRVSHMGEMSKAYTDVLIDALYDYYKVDRK